MARNKKRQVGALRFGQAVKTVLLCLLICGSLVGYLLQKKKIQSLGREMKTREVRLEKLEWENNALARRLADLQLPQRLDARVKELNLGLIPPRPDQIIWLRDPEVAGVGGEEEGILTARRGSR